MNKGKPLTDKQKEFLRKAIKNDDSDDPGKYFFELFRILEDIEVTPERIEQNSKGIVCEDGVYVKY
jgi:hypothetical protein